MTKINKLGKSTFVIAILSFLLVAVLAFGGTYAYFSATATATNPGVIKTGTLKLTGGGDSWVMATDNSLVPNQTIDLSFGDVAVEGTTVSALRIGINITKVEGNAAITVDNISSVLTISLTKATGASDWYDNTGSGEGKDGYYYYGAAVGGPEFTTKAISALATAKVSLAASAGNEYQGLTITYTISVEAVQAEFSGETGASPKFDSLSVVKGYFDTYATQHPANPS